VRGIKSADVRELPAEERNRGREDQCTDRVAVHKGAKAPRRWAALPEGQALRTSVQHFTLMADEKTILARLGERTDSAWAVAQLPRCLAALGDPLFGRHIDADALTADEIADEIYSSVDWNHSSAG
jgi:hypothetical protein